MTNDTLQPEIPRDRWKRPLVVPPDGGKSIPYTRCTTFVDVLDDKYNLQRWQQRMVAHGLALRPDLVLQMSTLTVDDKKAVQDVCEQAMEAAKARASATIGTALHALTEQIDRGQELGPVPDAYQADLDAYVETTAPLRALHIERFTVHDDLRIGGTPDRVVEHDGRVLIADVKTGSIEYAMLKIAMQLAVYAHSAIYDPATGERSDIGPVDLDEALIIHLPAGQGVCNLVSVDIAAGWEAVQTAAVVRQWRARKNLARPYTVADRAGDDQMSLDVDTPAPINDALANQIASAATVDDLTSIWASQPDAFTHEHVALASARKALLQQHAEQAQAQEGERAS